jgi:3-oxoacyl-[acyl-carrier-protein] synthase II
LEFTMPGSGVTVTGLGAISAGGREVDHFWENICKGETLAHRVAIPSSGDGVFACSVRESDSLAAVGEKRIRRLDRSAQLGLCAAEDAVSDAHVEVEDPRRAAIVVGTSVAGLSALESEAGHLARGRVNPLLVPTIMPNASAAALSMRFGWTGPALVIASGCAAGLDAVGWGMRMIQRGSADVVLAGGADAPIGLSAIDGFELLGLLARSQLNPTKASRPFDRDREGLVLGEGAAFLVLEKPELARRRGVTPYATALGYGASQASVESRHGWTGEDGLSECMRRACADAGIDPGMAGYINANALSTTAGDLAEARAIRRILRDRTLDVPVTSIKGALGYAVSASAALVAFTACLSLRRREIPPTANYDNPDGEIGLSVVRERLPLLRDVVLCNAFGLAGSNATVVFTGP